MNWHHIPWRASCDILYRHWALRRRDRASAWTDFPGLPTTWLWRCRIRCRHMTSLAGSCRALRASDLRREFQRRNAAARRPELGNGYPPPCYRVLEWSIDIVGRRTSEWSAGLASDPARLEGYSQRSRLRPAQRDTDYASLESRAEAELPCLSGYYLESRGSQVNVSCLANHDSTTGLFAGEYLLGSLVTNVVTAYFPLCEEDKAGVMLTSWRVGGLADWRQCRYGT